MRNFRERGLSREGLNFFGRGDIFSGGVGTFGGRVEIFWVGLGIIREAGRSCDFLWEGLRYFREGLRFFSKDEIIFGRG